MTSRDPDCNPEKRPHAQFINGVTEHPVMERIAQELGEAQWLASVIMLARSESNCPAVMRGNRAWARALVPMMSDRAFNRAWAYLLGTGFLEVDEVRSIIVLREVFAHFTPQQAYNHQPRFWEKQLKKLPQCAIVRRALELLAPRLGPAADRPRRQVAGPTERDRARSPDNLSALPPTECISQPVSGISPPTSPPLRKEEVEEEKKKTATAASRIGQPPLAGTVGELLPCLLSNLPHPVEQPAATQPETIAPRHPTFTYKDATVQRVMDRAQLSCRLAEAKEIALQDLLAQPAIASGIASGRIQLEKVCAEAKRSLESKGSLVNHPAHFYAGEVKAGLAAAARNAPGPPRMPATQRSWAGGHPGMGRDFPDAQEPSQTKSTLPDYTGFKLPPQTPDDRAAGAAFFAEWKKTKVGSDAALAGG